MRKKVYVFGHNDLDGVGVQILGRMYAEYMGYEAEVHQCTYTTINDEVMQMMKEVHASQIHTIIIGDISVNQATGHYLDSYCKTNHLPVILRDHHATAEHLNQYEWAEVHEKDTKGVLRCGTYWLWEYLMEVAPEAFAKMETFVKVVDSWDTWKWKTDNIGIYAKYLNALHKIQGAKKFTDYIMNLDMKHVYKPAELFDTYSEILVKTHEEIALHTARSCEESLWVTQIGFKKPHKNRRVFFTVGIVFCNNDISEVADYILTKHPELDFIMIGNLPKAFSLRTQKTLPIALGDIAEMLTGSGGGHPFSAGATVTVNQFQKGFYEFMNSLSKTPKFVMNSLYPNNNKSEVDNTLFDSTKSKTKKKSTKTHSTKKKFGKPNKSKTQNRG